MLVHCEWFWLNTSSKSTEKSSGLFGFPSLTNTMQGTVNSLYRLVLTSDAIRSVARYDLLVKITPTESEPERYLLMALVTGRLRHLWSNENYIVWVASRSQSINQSQITGIVIGWFFGSASDLIRSDGVVSGIGREWKRSDEGLTLETSAFEPLSGGQFPLSTQLIKPNYLDIQPAVLPH